MIFTYGPPGSGKTTVGQMIAEQLDLPYFDLDKTIEKAADMTVPEIFEREGENGFRSREKGTLASLLSNPNAVVALGGGTLLDEENRRRAEQCGQVICLNAPVEVLLERLNSDKSQRPLVNQDLLNLLPQLLEKRRTHYDSFPVKLDSTLTDPEKLAWQAQILLGDYRVRGMGVDYPVKVFPGSLSFADQFLLQQDLKAPFMVVSDENVAQLYAAKLLENLRQLGGQVALVTFTAGEQYKTVATVEKIWDDFTRSGLERGGTVVALGGGVTGDLAGFAAGTYLRGVNWVAIPTTLLAMVDAAVGGKTGADLPQGKNLVGVFHAPRGVLSDPETLESLPIGELRSGMAEVVKAAIIADPELFSLCRQGWKVVSGDWTTIVRRAVAVKIKVVQEDPYEKGKRAVLNLGHTVGHALEKVSGYSMAHGHAVAVGMVVEAHLAEMLKIAQAGLTAKIKETLKALELAVTIPDQFDLDRVYETMFFDKKRSQGKILFALPLRIGEVQGGIDIPDKDLVIRAMAETRG
jgi:shikimate kinase/3-dehydroquinate synthase